MNGSISDDCLCDQGLSAMDSLEDNDNFVAENSDIISTLLYENKLLRENLAESNAAMRLAYEKFAAAKEIFSKEQLDYEENCSQAKQVITSLREKILQNDLQDIPPELNPDVPKLESLRNQLSAAQSSLESASQERDELSNKSVSLKMQLESLVSNTEKQQLQDRQTIDFLQKTIGKLTMTQTKDKNEKQELNDSLSHLRLNFDELLLEFEKLIDDEQKQKAALQDKDNCIKQLQLKIEKLESENLELQKMREVLKSQFEAERYARQSLYSQYLALKAHLTRLTVSRDKQNASSGPSSLNIKSKKDVCVCPKCGREEPNIDSLQKHYHSCGD